MISMPKKLAGHCNMANGALQSPPYRIMSPHSRSSSHAIEIRESNRAIPRPGVGHLAGVVVLAAPVLAAQGKVAARAVRENSYRDAKTGKPWLAAQ